MSNSLKYKGYVEEIVAGNATSEAINDEPCNLLSIFDKQSLLNLLAVRDAARITETVVMSEVKGEQVGGTIEVGSFYYGSIVTVDVDNSAQLDELGTTQFVVDSDNDVLSESHGEQTWEHVVGRHHKARTFTVPTGVKVRYLFVLA